MRGHCAAHCLVGPAGNRNYNYRTYHRSTDYRKPLLGNQAETAHKPHSGRHEEEAEIPDKEIRNFVDPHQSDQAQFQSGGQQEHPYDTRWNRYARGIHNKFAHR